MIAKVADFNGMRVLEVGSGDGRMTSRLSGQASSVLSIDTDEEAIARAIGASGESAHRNVEYRVTDVWTITLPPSEFDAVCMALSL